MYFKQSATVSMHFRVPFLVITTVVVISAFPMPFDKDQTIIVLIRKQAVVYGKKFSM